MTWNNLNMNERHGIINRHLSEYVLNNIYGKANTIDEEVYYYFLISTFVIIEESFIKKDSKNSKIYFNYDENKEFVPFIKNLARPFIVSNSFETNKTQVIIEGNCSDDSPDLPLSIWILNKLRDSFSHGSFRIDLENSSIIIDNDKSEEAVHEESCVSINTIYENVNGLGRRTYENSKLERKNSYKLVYNLPSDILEQFIFAFDKGNKVVTKEMFKSEYNNKPFLNIENQIIEYNQNTDKNKTLKLIEKDNITINKMVKLLNVMSTFIKTQNVSEKDLITFMYLYTDMFMIFASRKDEELMSFNHTLVKLHKWDIDSNPEDGLEDIEYNTNIRKSLEAYDDFSNAVNILEESRLQREQEKKYRLKNLLIKLEKVLINKYISQKRIIVKTLRNAIMHAGFYLIDDKVYIIDKKNHHDDYTKKIIGTITLNDLRNVSKAIEGIFTEYSDEEELVESRELIPSEEKNQGLEDLFEIINNMDETIIKDEIKEIETGKRKYIIK